MKNTLFIIASLAIASLLPAQNCNYYDELMQKSQSYWKAGKFEQAINQLAAAREDCPSKGAMVDAQLFSYTNEIAKKYREAEVERKRAQREAARADSVAEVNRKAALTEYANALAYKSKIALQEGDRNTAFRLAEFAEKYVEKGNPRVLEQLTNSVYYDRIGIGPKLPRRENFQSSRYGICHLSFSSDGKYLVTGSRDSIITVWRLYPPTAFRTFNCGRRWANNFDLSPDGKRIAAGCKNSIQIWDIATGDTIKNIPILVGFVNSIAYSSNGLWMAFGTSDSLTTVYDLKDSKVITKVSTNSKDEGWVTFSPDGNLFATSTEDSTVTIWETQSGKPYYIFPKKLVWWCGISFSPDGKHLAIGGALGSETNIINLQSKEVSYAFRGHDGVVKCIQFSPNGNMIATGSMDGEVKVWNVGSGEELFSLKGPTSPVEALAFSTDNQRVASCNWEAEVKIWDLSDEQLLYDLMQDTPATGLNTPLSQDEYIDIKVQSYSPDGKRLLTIGLPDAATVWNLNERKIILRLEGHTDSVLTAAYSSDGKWIATGSSDSTIKVWDAETGVCKFTLRGHTAAVMDVVFAPNCETLASASRDHTCRLWNLESMTQIASLEDSATWVNCLAISPDGQLIATGSLDHQVRIWNINTRRLDSRLLGHTGEIQCIAFTSDGSQLLSGGDHMDSSIKLWNLKTGKNVMTFKNNGFTNYAVKDVAISPQNQLLAAGFGSRTVKIWNLQSGQLFWEGTGYYVAFSPSGKQLATGSTFKVGIWELETEILVNLWNKDKAATELSEELIRKYGLENLLDLNPDNEAKLIATNEVWQIKAFADVVAQQAAASNQLEKVSRYYERADRLYAASLSLQDHKGIRSMYARLLRQWAEVCRTDNSIAKATELETRADEVFPQSK